MSTRVGWCRALAGWLLAVVLVGPLAAGCGVLFEPLREATPIPASSAGSAYPLVRLAASWEGSLLAEDLAVAYRSVRPSVAVEVEAMSAGSALRAVASGGADLAIVAAADEKSLQAQALTLPYRRIARDGVALVAHPAAGLGDVGLIDLQALYAGDLWDWSQLSAQPGVPSLVVQTRGTALRQVFDRVVMCERETASTALILANDSAVLEHVAANPYAIGYVSAASALEDGRVTVVGLDRVRPGRSQLQRGLYPLTYDLYLLSAPAASDEAQAFWDYVGRRGRAAIEARYTLP